MSLKSVQAVEGDLSNQKKKLTFPIFFLRELFAFVFYLQVIKTQAPTVRGGEAGPQMKVPRGPQVPPLSCTPGSGLRKQDFSPGVPDLRECDCGAGQKLPS